MTRATAVPLLLICVMYGLVGPTPWIGAGVALAILLSLLIRARATATRLGETLLCLVLAIAAGAAVGTLVPRIPAPGTLKAGWAALAAAALIVIVARMWLEHPRGGDGATLAMGLLAMAFCGGVQSGMLFPAFAAMYLVTAAWALRRADKARAPLSAWRRYLLAGALMSLTGAAVGLGWAWSLPGMYDWVSSYIMQRSRGEVGFSERLRLGALDGLLDSERVVLRVHGEGVDHLRGIVYSHYYYGRWTQVHEDAPKQIRLPTERPAGSIEIELTDDEPDHYFLPMGAQDIALPTGVAQANRSSVLSPLSSDPSDRLWFRMGKSSWRTPEPPDQGDLELTWRVQRVLRPVAKEWTQGAKTVSQALYALERRLQKEARYALHVSPQPGAEPVVDFVMRGRQGHCEYFASAMAVMARTLGIPARVVGGYRVTERNPWGGYWVVRERNAHTWVEAWVPGKGWQTFDPTPASDLEATSRATTPTFAGAIDAIASMWNSFVAWLVQRSWFEVVTPLFALALLFVFARWWRFRRQRQQLALTAALPGFAALSEVLEGAGLARRPDETLAAFAERAQQTLQAQWAEQVAQAIRRYAAFRYGGRGERADLNAELIALERELRRARLRTPR